MFACECFLCTRNLFVKNNKQAWNCLDNLISLYYSKPFLSTVNKCIITITVIINVKSFLERHFFRISINSFLKKTFFYEKKLFCVQPLWCTAKLDKFYVIYLVLRRNSLQWLLPNIAYAIWKTILKTLNYVQCLNIAFLEKAWFMAPMEKTLWHQ